jgi:hypothetical protein
MPEQTRPHPQQPPKEEDANAGMPGLEHRRNWFRVRSWMRSELLHHWIQSLGILIAAGWGVYTFIYKDILVPAWQPANLTLEATLTPVAGRQPSPDGLEATLEAKATNSSSRPVYLLANTWLLSGLQRRPSPPAPASESHLLSQANHVLRQQELAYLESNASSQPEATFLAVGRLFDDNVVQAGETISRSLLVRIPRGTLAVELRAFLPLLSRQPNRTLFKGRSLGWELIDPLNTRPVLCSPAESPGREPTCKPVDAETIERDLQRFDPRKTAIIFRKQFGLPDGYAYSQ